MKSVWFIKTNLSAIQIYNDLARFIDNNDYLFVTEVTLNHMGWVTPETVEFLK